MDGEVDAGEGDEDDHDDGENAEPFFLVFVEEGEPKGGTSLGVSGGE